MTDKVSVPPLPRRHAPRPRLTRLLDEATAQVIVLNAPAGYGKTTLAAEWLGGRTDVAWYRATAASADIAAFAVGIAGALAPLVPGAGERLKQRVRLGEAPDEVRPLAELLAEDLAEWPDGAWLVLDDYQLLMESAAVEEFVELLLELAPLRLLVTTRRRPAWASVRRTLDGNIAEIGCNDLAMTKEEAGAVIATCRSRTVDALVVQAEGWPAVIALAALSASTQAPKARILDATFRYFAEEVLRRESPPVQELMLLGSVPPTLTARFGREVLALPETNAILHRLADDGLIEVVAHDTFRFHPLLRDFLRQKLSAERPDQFAKVVSEAIFAARDARRWEDAFEIAFEAGNLDQVEATTAEAAPALIADGRLETVEKWLRACSGAALQRPALALAHAEILLHRCHFEEAAALALEAARTLGRSDPLGSRAWRLAGEASMLAFQDEQALECLIEAHRRAQNDEECACALRVLVLVAWRLDLDALDEYVAELENVSAADLDSRLCLARARWFAGYRKGKLRGVWSEITPLISLADHAGDPRIAILFFIAAAHVCIARAEYMRALELAESAVKVCDRFRLQHLVLGALIPLAVAEISSGKLRSAQKSVGKIVRSLDDQNDDAVRILAKATLDLRLLIAKGSVLQMPEKLELDLDRGLANVWLAEYRALLALVAASVGDIERTRMEADGAAQLGRTAEVRFYVRFANVIAGASEGAPEEDVRREATRSLRECMDADMLDAFVTAYHVYPRLLDLVDDDQTALAIARRALGLDSSSMRDGDSILTKREAEVLRLMTDGLTNADIAHRLVISGSTVKVHVRHILAKLRAKNRLEAIVKATDGFAKFE